MQAKETLFDVVSEPELKDQEGPDGTWSPGALSAFNKPVHPQVRIQEINGKKVVAAYIPGAPTDEPLYLTPMDLHSVPPARTEPTKAPTITSSVYAGHRVRHTTQ